MTHRCPHLYYCDCASQRTPPNWGMIAAMLFSLSVWGGVIWAIVHHFGGGIRMALFGLGIIALIVLVLAVGVVFISWRKNSGGECL